MHMVIRCNAGCLPDNTEPSLMSPHLRLPLASQIQLQHLLSLHHLDTACYSAAFLCENTQFIKQLLCSAQFSICNSHKVTVKFHSPTTCKFFSEHRGFLLSVAFYEGRTKSHEQLFFACELGTTDEGECGGRWNQLFCYP